MWTGDELVRVEAQPLDYQIRNSNVYSIAAHVNRAGAGPVLLPVARDQGAETRALIERGLAADLLLISGGVSAGKYDLVAEDVLAEFGAEFYFDRVAMQPGAPLVFGKARGKFFFGLPGNPVSTMVTFELFAQAAIDLLSGCRASLRPMLLARLTQGLQTPPPPSPGFPAGPNRLWRSLPGAVERLQRHQPACRANGFLVADAKRESWTAGDMIQVLLK